MKCPPCDAWFVYILRCADGSLYTGITKDVKRRCQQHNDGTASEPPSNQAGLARGPSKSEFGLEA